MKTETYLLLVIAVLFIALVAVVALGRIDAQAADRLAAKNRHLTKRATELRNDLARLSARNAEMRDQLDAATGATREPSLTEEFHAWLANEPITYPEDPR